MFIRVRSRGGEQTATLVTPDTVSAYDVLHDPHLAGWPVPDFARDVPIVVKRAVSGERIFLHPQLEACDPLSGIAEACPGCLMELSWSQDGYIHLWLSFPDEGEYK